MERIILVCRNEEKTIVFFRGYTVLVLTEPFLEFMERLCNTYGTSIASNRKLAMKHFNYRKNTPLYISKLADMVLTPSGNVHDVSSFYYNAHQIRKYKRVCDRISSVEFMDGTKFEVSLPHRSIQTQINRSYQVKHYYTNIQSKLILE